jgi:glycosyltransferase involved in cell wall biosynthesis
MRVVIVSDFGAVNGGAAKVAIESARGLAEEGVDIVFAFAVEPASDRLHHPRIRLERFEETDVWSDGPTFAAARRGIWNEKAVIFLTELLRRQPSDTIVHLHQWTKVFSPAALGAVAESGLRAFITLHDYFSFCPTGGYFDFRAATPCTLQPMALPCVARHCDRASYAHKLVRVARQWRSNRALLACGNLTFVHVSNFARHFAQPFLPHHARHVTIENMTEANDRPRADVRENHHALFLGRLTQEKAPDLLASASLAVNMPVRFVGEGPLVEAVKAINPQADMRGWVSTTEALAELAAARCLVVPSIWFETGPLVVAEARSIGVPVVLARTTGAASWINDGEDGILVDGGDVQQLSAALRTLSDDATAGGMSEAAYRRYWVDPLTIQRHVMRTRAAYSEF